LELVFCIDKWLGVTCHTQPCRPCEITYILHYLPQGDESSPRGIWGICAPALPEVLTAEAEVGSIFSNEKETAPLRVMLEEMGHRQPPTPIQTDNSTAYGILNNKLHKKGQRQWTCDSTGSGIESHINNTWYTGSQAAKI
jgi:hypothetical protein